MRRNHVMLGIEALEDRCVPATWGNPWPDAAHLTISFVPDGTQVGNQTSGLFQTMNALAPTKVWQTAILQAFQTWAAQANINFSVVSDGGQPLGTAGSIQGDSRFGDIRIAAYPMAPGAEAESSPFELDAGTWAGDVNFNSAASFSVNGGAGQYDLFSVALHEAGHVLGFDVNTDPASVMDGQYLGVRTDLAASDVAAVQQLYGVRSGANAANNSVQTAMPVSPIANGNGSTSVTVNGTLASLQDCDFFSFNSGLNLGAVDVSLQTAGISLLTSCVTIFGPRGNTIATTSDLDPQDGGFVIHLANVHPFSRYYIEVESGQANAFGIGDYQLTVHESPLLSNLLGHVTATVTDGLTAVTGLVDAPHTNTTFATATPFNADSTYYAEARSSLNSAADVGYFSVQAPPAQGDTTTDVLTALVWGLQDQLNPRVLVFDAQGDLLPAQIIVNDGYTYAVQVNNALPGATYYLEVVQGPNGQNAGNYFVGADFSPNALAMQWQVNGSLTSASPVVLKTLDTTAADRSNLYHFVLSANASSDAAVGMTLTNAAGQVVFTLTAGTTEAVTDNVLLPPGVYYATFTATAPGGPIPAVSFSLLGDILTSPIGPEATDPTSDPDGSSTTGGSAPPTTWTDGSAPGVSSSAPASDPYSATPTVSLINPSDQTNLGGDSLQIALQATDSAGNPLTYIATGLPPGLSMDPNTGVISGTIAANAASTDPYVVAVTATDSTAGASATQRFYWTVNPPVISAASPGNQMNNVGDTVYMAISAACSDGAPLQFNAENLPPGLTIDPGTGTIWGAISSGAASADPYCVVIDILDPTSGVETTLQLTWTVC